MNIGRSIRSLANKVFGKPANDNNSLQFNVSEKENKRALDAPMDNTV